jgi:D-alanine-D-alanine ligase
MLRGDGGPAVKTRRGRERRRLRVLVLAHLDLLPPLRRHDVSPARFSWVKTEFDVIRALRALGHEVRVLGVAEELAPIREAVGDWRPDVVFNLVEEFQGEAVYDRKIAAYLERLRARYTGCGPRGMLLARDKSLAKQLAAASGVRVPRSIVVRRGRQALRPGSLAFPLIVKSLVEEGSMGISQASIVRDDAKLARRVRFVHERLGTDALVEEFVDGRELYVGVLGNRRARVLPPLELEVKRPQGAPLIATGRIKHDVGYQRRRGVRLRAPALTPRVARELRRHARAVYGALELTGYARLDFRLDRRGRLFFLEANPNPDVARGEEVARAGARAGLAYPQLLERIVGLGLAR